MNKVWGQYIWAKDVIISKLHAEGAYHIRHLIAQKPLIYTHAKPRHLGYVQTWCFPSSRAKTRIIWSRAPLVAQYSRCWLAATVDAMLETMTIAPPFCLSIIPLATTYYCVHTAINRTKKRAQEMPYNSHFTPAMKSKCKTRPASRVVKSLKGLIAQRQTGLPDEAKEWYMFCIL